MSTLREPVQRVARLVLEAATPLSISTGNPDGVFDSALVTDANGLPAIPGTSLAGVLRHLWWRATSADDAAVEALFGGQSGNEGTPSRLTVSWGALLAGDGRPVEGLLLGGERERLQRDPVLRAAHELQRQPVYRNRVRIGHRGAAADTGKFDRAVLPAGHRFAIEVRLAGGDDAEWAQLLALFDHPALRLGGMSRAGLGRVRRVALYANSFDLTRPEEARAFAALGFGLTDTDGLEPVAESSASEGNEAPADAGWLAGTLCLKANGFWRIGQGELDPFELRGDPPEKPADLLPVTEPRIVWEAGKGSVGTRALLFPASSLKGVLAHRMTFHARCRTGEWSDDGIDEATGDRRPEVVDELFGAIKDSRDGGGGHAGCLYLDDAFLSLDDATLQRLMHNAIDRFTGGVRDHVLYEEASLYGGEIRIPVLLDSRRLPEDDAEREQLRELFADTLADLCGGRLALGSRTTTGNGFFSGELVGPLADWLQDGRTTRQEVA